MKLGSLFSGIGGIDTAFESQGFSVAWQCEIDKSAQAVLRRHWPDTTQYGDVTAMNGATVEPVDIITFGSPCQDLSVAGKRRGFFYQLTEEEDELTGQERIDAIEHAAFVASARASNQPEEPTRSGLFFEAVRIIREMREATSGRYPTYALWENVPGAFSSNRGRDFAAVLDTLADVGALDIGWRVLDAQFFGVPQRRRRIYLVTDFGGHRAGEILALTEGGSRDTQASREAREGTTARVVAGVGAVGLDSVAKPLGSHKEGGQRNDLDNDTFVVANGNRVDNAITAKLAKGTGGPSGDEGNHLIVAPVDFVNVTSATNRTRVEFGSPANTLHQGGQAVVFQQNTRDEVRLMGGDGQIAGALSAESGAHQTNYLAFAQNQAGDVYTSEVVGAIATNSNASGRSTAKISGPTGIRRLTPTECERLMGLEDDWTAFTDAGLPIADTHRYRMIGNSVAVPVVAAIAAAVRRAMEAASVWTRFLQAQTRVDTSTHRWQSGRTYSAHRAAVCRLTMKEETMGVGLPKVFKADPFADLDVIAGDPLAEESAYSTEWDRAQDAGIPIVNPYQEKKTAIVKIANGDSMLVTKEIAIRDHGLSEADFVVNQPSVVDAPAKPRKTRATRSTRSTSPKDAGLVVEDAVELEVALTPREQEIAAFHAKDKLTAEDFANVYDDLAPKTVIVEDTIGIATLDEQAREDFAVDSGEEPYLEGEEGPNGGVMVMTELGGTETFLSNVIDMRPGAPLPAELQAERDAEQTKRKIKKSDQYDGLHHFVTPDWVVRACLGAIPRSPAPRRILDAGAGTGTWGIGASAIFPHADIVGVEINRNHDGANGRQRELGYRIWSARDFLHFPAWGEEWREPGTYDLVMSNPPFNQAVDFVRMGCYMANPDGGRVVMLLRLAILESLSRARDFWKWYTPESVTVFSKRPSFTGDGKTDSKTAYAAVVWRNGHRGDPYFRWFDPEKTDHLLKLEDRDPGVIYPIGWKAPESPETFE